MSEYDEYTIQQVDEPVSSNNSKPNGQRFDRLFYRPETDKQQYIVHVENLHVQNVEMPVVEKQSTPQYQNVQISTPQHHPPVLEQSIGADEQQVYYHPTPTSKPQVQEKPVEDIYFGDDTKDIEETIKPDIEPSVVLVEEEKIEEPKEIDPSVIGVIFGDVGTTSFKIGVFGKVEKSDYLEVMHPDCGLVLCQVGSIIRKTNYTLEKSLNSEDTHNVEEKIVASADVIGFKDEKGLLQVPRTTFKAGTEVRIANAALIKNILGLKDDPKSCAYLGLLKGYSLPMMLDINSLVQRHVSVLAKTGGGKSYVSGDIVEELMKHNVTCVIIDPHGEYGAMREPNDAVDARFGVEPKGYKDKIVEFGLSNGPNMIPLKFTFKTLEARDIMDLLPSVDSRTNLPMLTKAIDAVKERSNIYSVADVIEEIKANDAGRSYALVSDLEHLDRLGLFAERGNSMSELIQKGKTTIINLKGVAPDIQQIIVRRMTNMLFELRKAGRIPPLMLLVEEAHNYCPQAESNLCKKSLSTIASEGRKFGLGLMVVSQRPAKIDKNVLSQCGTQIILKVTNPNDLKAIAASIEGLTSGMEQDISGLPIGTAMIVGAGIQTPMLVEVRPRESRHGGESVKILDDELYE